MKICDIIGCENEGQPFWGEQITVGFMDRLNRRHGVKVVVGSTCESCGDEDISIDLCADHQKTVPLELMQSAIDILRAANKPDSE